jgi:hypothetical protein
MLVHLGLVLLQGGVALSKLGFPPFQPTVAVAELGVSVPELGVFLDVADQLLLDEIDEKVDFLLAVTTLTNTRPGERYIVNIGWSESHVLLPKSWTAAQRQNMGRRGSG